MRIPSSTVCYAFLPLTRKFLHQLQAHQLCFTDPERAVSPGEQGTMAEGNRSWAGPEPGAPAQLSPMQAGRESIPRQGTLRAGFFPVPASGITSTARAAGAVQNKCARQDKNPVHPTLVFQEEKNHSS